MKAILTDVTKCIGCRECLIACRRVNHLDDEVPRRWELNDGLSSRNWTSIIERDGSYVRKQCRHCLEPACVSACPVAALTKNSDGAVVYDSDRCLGCRYCMMACPYGIPRYDWDRVVPYVRKCILCAPRLAQGQQPACTEACPVEATIFGEREELLREAHRRIRENPDRYIDHIWGEDEVGGTAVLYISNVDLSFLAYGSRLKSAPLPRATAPAMHAVPVAFVGMAGAMAGLNWIIKRRGELSAPKPTPEEKTTDADDGEEQDG